jgi:O-antigen ligase
MEVAQGSPRRAADRLLGYDNTGVARLLAGAAAAMAVAMEFKVRNRSATASLDASIDGQIAAELAIATIVGVWIVARRLHRDAARSVHTVSALYRPSSRSVLFMLRVVVFMILVSSIWSPTTIAPVRAVEVGVLAELCIELSAVAARTERALSVFFRQFEQLLVLAILIALVVSMTSRAYQPFEKDYFGVSRFHLLAMHPIATADFLGAAAIFVWARLLYRWAGTDDADEHFSSSVLGSATAFAIGVLLIVGVVLTRERGPMVATVVAIGVLIATVPNRHRARLAAFWGAAIALGVVATEGHQIYDSIVLRGQSTSNLSSVSGRTQIWAESVRLFVDHPVVGSGYLTGRSAYLSTISFAGRSHNAFVEIAVSLGVVGIVAFAMLFIRWFTYARHGLGTADERQRWASLAFAIATFILLVGLIDDSFAGTPGILTILLCLGAVLADTCISRAARREVTLASFDPATFHAVGASPDRTLQ